MENLNKYYVYAYLDPRKKGQYYYGDIRFEYEPFYIGKGCGNRWKNILTKVTISKSNDGNIHKVSRVKNIVDEGFTPIIVCVFDNLVEETAYLVETVLISLIGRRDLKTGYLCNHTDGGDGSRNMSQETRDKISAKSKGHIPWNKGRTDTCSEETRKKISKTLTGRKRGPMSDAQKDSVSKVHKNKIVSEETKKRLSKARQKYLETHPVWNKGKKEDKINE